MTDRQEKLIRESQDEAKAKAEAREMEYRAAHRAKMAAAEAAGLFTHQLWQDDTGREQPQRIWALSGTVGPEITQQEFDEMLERIRERRLKKKQEDADKGA